MRFILSSLLNFKIFANNGITTQLGRWTLKYDEKSIGKTVLLANEDHCGCCQENQQQQQRQRQQQRQQQSKIKDYDTNHIDEYILINIDNHLDNDKK
jgi:hypothetical protein